MSADDFDIDSLAAYLHLTPQQVARLADRGKLPGRKVTRFDADVQVFAVVEPRAQVTYWRLRFEKRAGRWTIVERQDAGFLKRIKGIGEKTAKRIILELKG